MSLYYCKKCGRLIQNSWNDENLRCDCCQTITNPVPIEFLDGKTNAFFKDKNTERQFIEKLVKNSPEFDQNLFDHRDEMLAKQSNEFNAKMEHGRAVLEGNDKGNPYGVTCPYCKATNVRKITATNKTIHTSVFGIWSIGRNAKNYHCDHCGSEF